MPASSGPGFSPGTAAIFIFNLVVGTGALALPNAFEQVWLRVVKSSSSESCSLYGLYMFNIGFFTGWLAPGNSSLAPPRPCEIPMSLLSFSSTLIIINSMLICHHHLCHLHNHHHPHDHHRSHHDMVKVSFAW